MKNSGEESLYELHQKIQQTFNPTLKTIARIMQLLK